MDADWSKQEQTIGCAAIYNKKMIKKHLPNDTSIFNAEACTVDMVLKILLCWIPSHGGISGNEKVDKVARFALSMVPEKILRFHIQT